MIILEWCKLVDH